MYGDFGTDQGTRGASYPPPYAHPAPYPAAHPAMYPVGHPPVNRPSDGFAIALGVALWTISGGAYLLGLAFLMMIGIFVLAAGGPTLLVVLAAALPAVLAAAASLVLAATPYFRTATRGTQVALLGTCFTAALILTWGSLALWAQHSL